MKQKFITAFIFVQISEMTSDNFSLFLTQLSHFRAQVECLQLKQSVLCHWLPGTGTSFQTRCERSSTPCCYRHWPTSVWTSPVICAEVCQMHRAASFQEGGSIANMRNYSLDMRNLNKKLSLKQSCCRRYKISSKVSRTLKEYGTQSGFNKYSCRKCVYISLDKA